MENPKDHSDLIAKLGGPSKVAIAIGIGNDVNVRAWKMRNRIPPEYWPAMIGIADGEEFSVTADWLMQTTPPRQNSAAA
jgi:hypothetical protein